MTDSFGAGGRDIWMSKLDPAATVTWQKTYGGAGDDVAYAVRETADGGYIVAGCTSSFGAGGYDAWVLKLDSGGTIAWERTYGGTADDGAQAIQLTPDGEYIVAGWTESFGEGSIGYPDIWVLRLDQDGEIGGCASILDSNAIVSDTTVLPQDTNAPVLGTFVNPSGTAISPQDVSVNASTVCSESAIPMADFSADPTDGKNPLIVQFTDLSTGDIGEYSWNFGDESSSTDQHPIHQYQSIGTYNVRLKVTGPAGSDKEKKVNYINVSPGLPIADFKGSPTVGTPPFTVTFVDQSSEQWGPIDTRIWDFGDGIVREYDSTTVFHAYGGGADAWTVSLTVIGPGGSDTKTKIDYIHLPDYTPSHPVIEKITPRSAKPGEKIKIVGYNFGDKQRDSIVHINNKTFDKTSPKIRDWGDTLIKIKVPFTKKGCQWFKHGGGEYRKRKVWVTVGGGDSDKKRLKVLKPDTCP
jgi:PKD repeat protein